MAKFVYHMQSILDIKGKLETQEKMAYATARAKLFEEEAKLDKMKQRRLYYEEKMRDNMNETLNIKALNECHQGLEIMKAAIKQQKIEVDRAQKEADNAQDKLNEAVKERKTYEKLRENAFEEFVQDLNVQEGKEIDELVSYNYTAAAKA